MVQDVNSHGYISRTTQNFRVVQWLPHSLTVGLTTADRESTKVLSRLANTVLRLTVSPGFP